MLISRTNSSSILNERISEYEHSVAMTGIMCVVRARGEKYYTKIKFTHVHSVVTITESCEGML